MPISRLATQFLFAIYLTGILWIVIQRLLLGIDLSDESFYIAIVRSMTDWGPFTISSSLAQFSSSFLLVPIEIWRAIGMGDRGIILCLRMVYLLTLIICCCVFYLYAKKRLQPGTAKWLSLLPLTWIPLGIPALSYNTIAEECFLCALLLFSLRPSINVHHIRIWIANCLFVIACLVYPTLSLACLFFFVLRFALARDLETRKGTIFSLCFFVFSGLVVLASFVFSFGFSRIRAALSMVAAFTSVTRQHMDDLLSIELNTGNVGTFCSLSFLSGAATIFSKNAWSQLVVYLIYLTTLFTVAMEHVFNQCNSHADISLACMFLIPWLFCARGIPTESRIAFFSSIFAGLVFSRTSGNAALNFSIGAFPALCIGLCEFLVVNQLRSTLEKIGATLLTGATAAIVFLNTLNLIGEENGINLRSDLRLSVCVRIGPYAWLRTTPIRKIILQCITNDLKSLKEKGKRTIYVIGPPGFYICSDLKPLDPIMYHLQYWNGLQLVDPWLKDFFRIHGLPDVIVQSTDPFYGKDFGVPTPFEKDLLDHQYRLLMERSAYRIFVPKNPISGPADSVKRPSHI
jgi:hypothetical protein